MKKFNKLYLLAFVLIFLSLIESSYVNATQQSLGTYQVNSCISLKQICGNCTFSNVTSVVSPNSTILLSDVQMQKTGTEYNYTFCNTNSLGYYIVNGVSDVNGINTVWVYDFNITPTGDSSNIGFFIILTIAIVGILMFGIFTRNIPVTMIGALCTMAWGVYVGLNGFDIFRNLGTQVLSIIMIAFAGYWGINAGLEYLNG